MTTESEPLPDQLHTELLVRQLQEKTRQLELANAALRASEAALKRSQEIAHIGHWVWDVQTNRVTWSDEMRRIFGVDPTAFDGNLDRVIQRTIHPDDRERLFASNAAVRDQRRPASITYRVVWPDGSIRHVWAAPADPVLDEQGAILQLSGIIQDITERANREQELRRSLRRTAVASRAAGLGFWEFDVRANVQLWDDPMYTLYGLSRQEFDPTFGGWLRWVHPDDAPRLKEEEEQALAAGKTISSHFRVVRPDGAVRYVETHAEVERDEAGRPLRLLGVDRDITDLVASEQQMQLQSAALRAAANAIVITDLKGSIEWINPAFTRLTGYTVEESVGRTLGALLRSGMQNASFYEDLWHSIAAGQVWQGELVNRRKDGSHYIEEQTITPVLDAAGAVTHFVAIKQDISARKQHEREMEAVITVSAALRMLTTRDEMLPVIVDQLQALFAADGAAIEMLDAGIQQMVTEIGRGVWASLEGVIVPHGGVSAAVLASGGPYLNNNIQQEDRLLHPHLLAGVRSVAGVPLATQGNRQGTLWIASRETLSDHDLRVLTAIADIAGSALQRASFYERTQRQAEEMAQIMRSVPDGLLLLDAHCTVVTATPRAEHYLEVLAGVGRGETLTHLGGSPLLHLLTAPPTGQHHTVQAAGRTFEVSTRPVEAGPATSGWVLVIGDVTAELTVQEQLRRQERLAAIGQLAAGIAHDFNNIMSVITVYAQLLAVMPEMSDRARERIQTIDRQAWRATDMIRQILDFSRRAVIERQPLDLLHLLDEQVRLLERTLPENIEISVRHDAGPFVVHADSTRLAQAIMNLSINARDAMPEGGQLTFTVDAVQTASSEDAPLPSMGAGEWVRLRVTDTGIGMTPEILRHIFEPFYTTKEPGHGTGLGLPQVHGIIGQHGGHVQVESEEGAGSCITIYLPAEPVATGAPRRQHSPSDLPAGHGKAILLVEDEPVLRESMADLLMLWGYAVVKAANGEQALDILSTHEQVVHLVLTDVVMPVLGGIGLLKQMRQRGMKTPVVVMTGHPLRDELEGLRHLGLAAWMNKPPNSAQLARTLAHVLGGA